MLQKIPANVVRVKLVLSRAATQAWKDAGSLVFTDFGNRIIAVFAFHLKIQEIRNSDIFLVSAYAPIGVSC